MTYLICQATCHLPAALYLLVRYCDECIASSYAKFRGFTCRPVTSRICFESRLTALCVTTLMPTAAPGYRLYEVPYLQSAPHGMVQFG